VTLRIAARYAQYTNFGNTVAEFTHKSELLRGHCAEVGTDFDAIVRSSDFNVLCAASEAEVEAKKQWLADHLARYVEPHRAERFAALFEETSGTPEQIVSYLKEWEAAGLDYAIITFADVAYDRTGLELFAKEVLPALT
jgi:alkanesulfonate monooxygenase SsuD/methylene tetrahydromethanopterin reductase-like flavin-dependent oxidoreductase (luciferase family)